jgi:hypothetical protein
MCLDRLSVRYMAKYLRDTRISRWHASHRACMSNCLYRRRASYRVHLIDVHLIGMKLIDMHLMGVHLGGGASQGRSSYSRLTNYSVKQAWQCSPNGRNCHCRRTRPPISLTWYERIILSKPLPGQRAGSRSASLLLSLLPGFHNFKALWLYAIASILKPHHSCFELVIRN